MVLNNSCTVTRLVCYLQVLRCPGSDVSLIFSSLLEVLIANARILLCPSRTQPPVTSLLLGTEINFQACLVSSTSSPLASSFSGALRLLEGDGRSYVSNAFHCSPHLNFSISVLQCNWQRSQFQQIPIC